MANTPQHPTPAAARVGGVRPPPNADVLRRLSRLKNGITIAAVLACGVISAAIATQPAGTPTTATATAPHTTATTAGHGQSAGRLLQPRTTRDEHWTR